MSIRNMLQHVNEVGTLLQQLPTEEDVEIAAHQIVLDMDEDKEQEQSKEEDGDGLDEDECQESQHENSDAIFKEYVVVDRHSSIRRFAYKGKYYCYSKEVFTEMLMKDIDEPHTRSKTTLKLRSAMMKIKPKVLHYLSARGIAPTRNCSSYNMDDFSSYNGVEKGREIVSLMKKWNSILHPKEGPDFQTNHHAQRCSFGVVVAAILHVEGKTTNLPSYQSDLLHKKIKRGTTSVVSGACLAVILFHDCKMLELSPACSVTRSGAPTDQRFVSGPSSGVAPGLNNAGTVPGVGAASEAFPVHVKVDIEGASNLSESSDDWNRKAEGLTETGMGARKKKMHPVLPDWMVMAKAELKEVDNVEKRLAAAILNGQHKMSEDLEVVLAAKKMHLSMYCSLGGATWEVTQERLAMLFADAEDADVIF